MKTLKKLIGLGAIIVALNSCGHLPEEAKKKASIEYSKEYFLPSAENPISDEISTLEGRIINVRAGHVSYDFGGDKLVTHELEYVTIFSPIDNKHHILIYPYTKEFLEQYANIKFRQLKNGNIDVEKFIDAFLNPVFYSLGEDAHRWNYPASTPPIEAEGIITKDGIEYIW